MSGSVGTNVIASCEEHASPGLANIISDEDIIRDWGVTLSFVNQHSKQMKPFKWRPRRYFRKFVEEFFISRATEHRKKGKYTRAQAVRDFEDARARMCRKGKNLHDRRRKSS